MAGTKDYPENDVLSTERFKINTKIKLKLK